MEKSGETYEKGMSFGSYRRTAAFALPGFSPSPVAVVFSTRYLSLTAFMRHVFVDDWLKYVLVDVSERTTLKLMSEMALRYGDPDYAVLAFVKSMTGKSIWLNDDDQVDLTRFWRVKEEKFTTESKYPSLALRPEKSFSRGSCCRPLSCVVPLLHTRCPFP